MHLAKALKQRNRIVKKINDLQGDILRYNSLPVEAEKEVVVKDLMKELDDKTNELIRLKVKMFEASRPIRDSIFRIAELKSKVSFLNGMDTTRGKVQSNHRFSSSDTVTEYEAAFTKAEVEAMKATAEEQIDTLQDEIEQFNYKTEVEH